MTLLMLDQADDLNSVQTMSLYMMWFYPLPFIGATVASWMLYHKRKFREAVWVGFIPLLWVVPLILFFA